jgi:hypothetical protein
MPMTTQAKTSSSLCVPLIMVDLRGVDLLPSQLDTIRRGSSQLSGTWMQAATLP